MSATVFSEDLLTVLVTNLPPGFFEPSRSHTRQSLLMIRTRFVSDGCPHARKVYSANLGLLQNAPGLGHLIRPMEK